MPTKTLTESVFDEALRSAFDKLAADRKPRANWTEALDREIWRAKTECGIGSRDIAAVLKKVHGWGSRDVVQDRLAFIRKHGGPEGVPR